MPDYNKTVFHDEVFQRCGDILESFEEKSDNLFVLKEMFLQAKKLLGDSEKRFISSYTDKNEEEAILVVVNLIKKLMDFFSTRSFSHNFTITFDYIYKISSLYDLESFENVLNSYYRFDNRFRPVTAPKIIYARPITFKKSFYIFYKIVWCIIQDLNNQEEAWEYIGNYYYKKYIIELNKEECHVVFTNELKPNTPITFLSYAFKDRAYSLYLFAYFIENGGFLFVDAIFGKKREDGISIKDFLNPWIRVSVQLLFLRSVTSDNNGVRQWCAWEIGRSYDGHHSFYTIDIIGVSRIRNMLLDGFSQFNCLIDGIIY